MKRSQIKEGMVFGVPMPNGKLAVVQLIKQQKPIFYMAGFDLVVSDPTSFEIPCLYAASVLFLGNFFDDMIKTDQWICLGIAPIKQVPYPITRVFIAGKWVIESWDGKKIDEMPLSEAERYPMRSNHGGVLMQEALLNYFGFLEVDDYVKKYLPEIRAEFVSSISSV